MKGLPRGWLTAIIAWSLVCAGSGYLVGLVSEAPTWFYDVSYNPMTPALIAIATTVVIWAIDRSGKK